MGDTTSPPVALSVEPSADAPIADFASPERVNAFVNRWKGVVASELATAQSFVLELCELLELPRPTHAPDYMFERPVTFRHGDGSSSAGRIDCYLRGHFVLEAKKLRRGAASNSTSAISKTFDAAMLTARAQAEGYARALPAAEGRPPFLIVLDVGNVIELYAEFSRSGATYTPFPDPRHHRIRLADLALPEVRQRLRQIWLDPDSLNTARASARVTREVAAHLARLAASLERSGQRADQVGAYLTRCLFSMFAEDIALLPKGSFLGLLQTHRAAPTTLAQMLRALWVDMDHGGFSSALAQQVLRFNGKLFKQSTADGYSLLLNEEQIDLLILAAKSNWREVEPAIFGTLLERALAPTERHALGAHYTPRAYVERLVLPTVMEPLRADWANTQAAALLLVQESEQLHGKAAESKLAQAVATVRQFLRQLCTTRVLDPACGSGNFLYVTLEHLKRLEGEVINQLEALGETQDSLGLDGETVTPQQLLGLEINERAAALAELVLWIGHLQWHIRTRGNKAVSEPVVHDYGNIECRDAVLAWDDIEPAYDDHGLLLTRWDGHSVKPHPATGLVMPDEAAQVPQWCYIRPRKAKWPQADFIVGNPPFIGASALRTALGDGYAQTLRDTWWDVPESADFVMYWWHQAAQAVRTGATRRFGLITTNSLRQTFNRRVVEAAMAKASMRKADKAVASKPVSLVFAIPDHPWVDSTSGAAVRIAMTVGQRGKGEGLLQCVLTETTGEYGEVDVSLSGVQGLIHADLSVGANVASASALQANERLSNRGVQLFGAGFIVTPEEATALGLGTVPGLERHIRDYRNGRDLTARPRGVKVIDLLGLNAKQVRSHFPAVYQWVMERVKPARDAKGTTKDGAGYAALWWLFGKPRQEMRKQLSGLPRYIATVETAKHRTFQFLDASILPDNKLVAIAVSDAFHLGVLSSGLHGAWALATGSWLGVGNDPVYVKSRCFETFPFPDTDTGLTPELRQCIADTAEQIDAHRKRQQAAHPRLTLTGMYNVLEVLRTGRALTNEEVLIHTQGLVTVLKELHEELDAAVVRAYGWTDVPSSLWLDKLLALHLQRASEEAQGLVRWLRPEFQLNSLTNAEQTDEDVCAVSSQEAFGFESADGPTTAKPLVEPLAWPAGLPEQMRAVSDTLDAAPDGLTLAQLESAFKGRGAWKKSLPRILDTLAALGRVWWGGGLWHGGHPRP